MRMFTKTASTPFVSTFGTLALAVGAFLLLASSNAAGIVGDPQIKTTHDWNPGELSCSTFPRLWAEQKRIYERETSRTIVTDQDKVIAAWYWRNLHYYHSTADSEDIVDTGIGTGDYLREYWMGLFGYGFALCYQTHTQFCGEIEQLVGHGCGRAITVNGHTSFEAFIPSINDWAVVDHDISTIVFNSAETQLLSLVDCQNDLSVLNNAGAPTHNQGWFIAGLYYNSPTDNDAYGTYNDVRASMENGGYAGNTPKIVLRRGEKFRRYKEIGLGGTEYVYWGINYNAAGKMGPSRERQWVTRPQAMFRATEDTPANVYVFPGNGVYTYAPDFNSLAYKDGVSSESGSQVTFEFFTPYVIGAKAPDTTQWGVRNTGCTRGLIVSSNASSVTFNISTDNCATWSTNRTLSGSVDVTDLVKSHHSYHIRFNAGPATLAPLNISMRTVVQVNRTLVPELVTGNNTITYQASGKGVLTAGPNKDQSAKYITSGTWGTSAPITMDIPTPRGEKILEVFAAMYVETGGTGSGFPPSDRNFDIDYNTGSGWLPIVDGWHLANRGYAGPDGAQSQSWVSGTANIASANASSVQVRFTNDSGRNMLRGTVWVVYQTANDSECIVRFNYTDGSGAHTVEHTYPAGQTTNDTSWTFTTSGTTTTNWVEYETVSVVTPVDGIVEINDINFTADRTNYATGVPQQTVTVTLSGAGQVDAVNFTAPAWATVTGVPSSYPRTTDFTLTISVNPKAANIADGNYSFDINLVDSLHSAGSVTFTVNLSVADDAGRPDGDSDGIPDVWELRYFDTIGDCVPTEDSGGSSLTNIQEYVAGTNPVAYPKSITSTKCALDATRTDGSIAAFAFGWFALAGIGALCRTWRESLVRGTDHQ